MKKDEIVVLSNDIEIINGVEVDWSFFEINQNLKGNNLIRAKKRYIDICISANRVGFKLCSNYTNAFGKVVFKSVTNDKVKILKTTKDFKEKTCKSIFAFFDLIKKEGDVFLGYGVKNNKLTAKLKTFDNVVIEVSISQYKKFCFSRKETYEYLKEKGYVALSGYANAVSGMLIDFGCGHSPRNVKPNDFKAGKGCLSCAKDNKKKEKHPMWKGGITPLSNHLRGVIKNSDWHKVSFSKHNGKCVITGYKTKDIQLHHLRGFNSILLETIELLKLELKSSVKDYSNIELRNIEETFLELHWKYGLGVPLTKNIHNEFHNLYGRGDNTPEQFEEFKKMKQLELRQAS